MFCFTNKSAFCVALLPLAVGVGEPSAMMLGGVVVLGIASGMYLAADLGAGPRDGLMTGLHHRFGWSIRRAGTMIELSVLALGWLLGGTIGLGTLAFAVGIVPLVQFFPGEFDPTGRIARCRPALTEGAEQSPRHSIGRRLDGPAAG